LSLWAKTRFPEPLECRKPLRNPFRVVQSIDPDDECPAGQAVDHAPDVRRSHRTLGKTGESRRFYTDWKYADPHCPIGEDEIEVVAMQAAFSC
jgi:hypothetical protein